MWNLLIRAGDLKGFLLGWLLGSGGEVRGGGCFALSSHSHLDEITIHLIAFSQ